MPDFTLTFPAEELQLILDTFDQIQIVGWEAKARAASVQRRIVQATPDPEAEVVEADSTPAEDVVE